LLSNGITVWDAQALLWAQQAKALLAKLPKLSAGLTEHGEQGVAPAEAPTSDGAAKEEGGDRPPVTTEADVDAPSKEEKKDLPPLVPFNERWVLCGLERVPSGHVSFNNPANCHCVCRAADPSCSR
jgi:hypothetical protein